jgi:hypothetical protein
MKFGGSGSVLWAMSGYWEKYRGCNMLDLICVQHHACCVASCFKKELHKPQFSYFTGL